ncbi:hypothetical protein CYY_004570 [Polysphondylium violaceum]|uniref:Sucraseferredoxin-like family protein n=1 Tax=Polysphondylium violaceum TaxID=133409 RepID=A0A8J4V099_9MYCE|nr:hypothetical protein CYY_004570 [Polysphondylium violaceum]
MHSSTTKVLTLVGLSACVAAIIVKYFTSLSNKQLGEFNADPAPVTTADPSKVGKSYASIVAAPQNAELGDIEDLDSKCGFCRPEMVDKKSPVANSIHEYKRHFFICTGIAYDQWPSKAYSATEALEKFSQSVKKFEKNERAPALFNGTDMPSTNADSFDLIVFPENVKFVGLTNQTVEDVLTYFQENDGIGSNFPAHIKVETLSSKYLFVCAHKQKDERCGYCGPILMDDLRKEISKRNLDNDIKVYGSTHVGGHKFAGNVLVFPEGHWYGYVTPNDVNQIIDSTLNGDIIQNLYRGGMGKKIEKPEKK